MSEQEKVEAEAVRDFTIGTDRIKANQPMALALNQFLDLESCGLVRRVASQTEVKAEPKQAARSKG